MGTPHYLSPEQAQGFEVTSVSDLYSIGVLLYEALTGRVPFEGESAVAVAMKQVSQTPQRPSSINPRVSPALDAVVMRALEKEPGERFQSADAFIAALDAAMREPGVGGGTAAFAPLPPVVAAEEEGPEEEERQAPPWLWIAARDRRRRRSPDRPGADQGDDDQRPQRDRQASSNVAIAQLEREGFSVGKETTSSARRRAERRCSSRTALRPGRPAEARAARSSPSSARSRRWTLTVSAGPGSGTVPGTAGLTVEEATEKLEAAEFQVQVENVSSDSVEEGLVIHSEPSGGESATHGSPVTLFVSSGPKLVKVPVLVGSQRAVAVQEIRARGLVPSVSEEETAATRPAR